MGDVPSNCTTDITLRWMTETASSIYATPVIADLFSDGQKEVIVPTFVHYLEVLEVRTATHAHACFASFVVASRYSMRAVPGGRGEADKG